VQITVCLLASFRRYLPEGHDAQGGYPCEVAPGTRAGDVLATLPIPPDHACTFFVNGRHAGPDQVLQAGDVLSVFPPAGGG
jgi:molybdopterin synthase sulfur carrier subunit